MKGEITQKISYGNLLLRQSYEAYLMVNLNTLVEYDLDAVFHSSVAMDLSR